MRNCKSCGCEITDKECYCPYCGQFNHGVQNGKNWTGIWFGVCLFFVGVFVMIKGFQNFVIDVTSPTYVEDVQEEGVVYQEGITLEKYNKIKTNMKYKQVVEIIGCEGELSSEYGERPYHYASYAWYGSGELGANAVITFENGRVIAKAQYGLK